MARFVVRASIPRSSPGRGTPIGERDGAAAAPRVGPRACPWRKPRLELVPALEDPEAEAEAEVEPRSTSRGGVVDERRGAPKAPEADAGPAQALRPPDRRRPPPDAARRSASSPGARTRATRRRRSSLIECEPPARDVDHPQLHEGGRAAPRPDPGGQPRPDPRGREVRLQDGLQALDLRDLVDPPVDHPRARRPGPDDPAARPRRRAGAPPDARAPRARAEAQPRPDARRARRRERLPGEARPGAARPRRGPGQPRDARRRRREPLRRPDRGPEREGAARDDGARSSARPSSPTRSQRLNPRMRHVLAAPLRPRRAPVRRRSRRSAPASASPASACASSSLAPYASSGRSRPTSSSTSGPSSSSAPGAFVREERRTAPTTTAANEAIRAAPTQPPGSGSLKTIIPAAIGSALVNSVARPAVVSAPPRWKPACRTAVPAA